MSLTMNNVSTNYPYDCLIYESGYTGHRPEYISHIMNFINKNPSLYGKYVFVLNENVADCLGNLNSSTCYKIHYFNFRKKHQNSINRGFWEWKRLSLFFKSTARIKEIIFLDIDPYLVLVGSRRFTKFKMKVKGILFQPYIHFSHQTGSSLNSMTSFFKSFLFQKYATWVNPDIKQLFILNDRSGTGRLNKGLKDIFHFLPDPIDTKSIVVTSVNSILDKFHYNRKKQNLLLFGRIDRRKNLINILDGLTLLPDREKHNINLVIAGQFDESVKTKYLDYIEKHRGQFDIFYNNDFVTDEERELLFRHTDLVLMPYINFYSSSGVLGHTIKNGKNVIVSKKGIVSRIVEENEMGMAVDPMNPEEIKNAIYELLYNQKSKPYENQMLIDEYSPSNFSKILLGDPE